MPLYEVTVGTVEKGEERFGPSHDKRIVELSEHRAAFLGEQVTYHGESETAGDTQPSARSAVETPTGFGEQAGGSEATPTGTASSDDSTDSTDSTDSDTGTVEAATVDTAEDLPEDVQSIDEAVTTIMDGTLDDLRDALDSGALDDHLDTLHEYEENNQDRAGAYELLESHTEGE